jgi:hypothetical protein
LVLGGVEAWPTLAVKLVLGGVEAWPTLAVIPTCAMATAVEAIAAASSAWRMPISIKCVINYVISCRATAHSPTATTRIFSSCGFSFKC